MVVDDLGNGILKMYGRIFIRDTLILTVNKIMKERESKGLIFVKSIKYSYNLSTIDDKNVFRYDNVHVHAYLGHISEFHVHKYDVNTGQELAGSPIEVLNLEDWPTLGEVILEADRHYWEGYSFPFPNAKTDLKSNSE